MTCAEKADRFRGASSFRTFLFGIARNVLREHLRKVGRRRKRESDEELDLDALSVTAMGHSPVSAIFEKQEQRLLLEGLRLIPLFYQVALELHYWQNLTAKEIAEVTEAPVGMVKTRLRDGKILLGKKLAQIASSEAILSGTMDNLEQWWPECASRSANARSSARLLIPSNERHALRRESARPTRCCL